ncbi:LysR family transcriptional regulator [Sphingobium boeckii]|uniref:DNA-binding transcriptional LysR family regulator n=1 Tax=Sphingobium boeckii TaxID=1082345 RepID=A0A7W9EF49_9SPHN|nr:LysR family transcriptional regulator [Sphingobium boeckii]MBB5686867.1 DNA-binding transcriptional LysR family regulator [Sphingobium boeckii]
MWDNALHYFYEAANMGSMRLASDKIGVAVSSISRQIAQLEQQMGVALIERGRRSIRLTEAGEHTLEFYRHQIADREALMNRLQELREVKTGRVDLAVGEGFLGNAFTAIIDGFHARNPGMTLSVTSCASSEIVRMVLDDEAHIGMILHTTNEPKIRTRATAAQPLMVLCAPDHPAARMGSIDLATLAEFDLCLPPKGFRIRTMLNEAERREQIWLEAKMVTTSLLMMREMAKAGRMVTILPAFSAQTELDQGLLVARPLIATELEHTTISLIHRVGRQLDGGPARLLAILEAKLKSWSNWKHPETP